MSNVPPLKHCTIINPPPAHQARDLTAHLESLGANIIEVPCISIKHEEKNVLQRKILQLKQPDFLIFVSANAVHSLVPHYNPPKKTHVIAIGSGTAEALKIHNISTDSLPSHFSSQGILELPILKSIANQHIVISCGYDSNPLLQNELKLRGATVQSIESYTRTPAMPPSKTTQEYIRNTPIHAIIITSQDSLEQLPKQLSCLEKNWAKEKQLLVITEKQAQQAHKAGFTLPPWIAKQADTQTIINCLLHHTIRRR